MKNTALLIPALTLLAACASSDTTLFEKMSDKNAPTAKVEVVETEMSATNIMYRVPTRNSRYMENEPAPEAYAIAARRATNKMLDESRNLYENTGHTFIYIADLKKADRQMPDGTYNAARATKKMVQNSRTFKVVENLEEADLILEPVIDNAGSPEEPILVYKLVLFDTENNKVGQWTETLRRVMNDDQSWW